MGYSYYFLITLEHTGGVSLQDIEAKHFPLWRARYDTLAKEEWFPTVATLESSSAGGYGTGPNKHLLQEFVKFTSHFAAQTFGLHLVWWDYSNISGFIVKEREVVSTYNQSYEEVKVGPMTVSINLPPDNLTLPNDITYIFGSAYRDNTTLDWSEHPEAPPPDEKGVTLSQVWSADWEQFSAVLGHKITWGKDDIDDVRVQVAQRYLAAKMLTPSAAVMVADPDFKMVAHVPLDTTLLYLERKRMRGVPPLTEASVLNAISWPKEIIPLKAADPVYTALRPTVGYMKEYITDYPATLTIDGPRYIGASGEIFNREDSYTLRPGVWRASCASAGADILAHHVDAGATTRMTFERYTTAGQYFGILAETDLAMEIKAILQEAKSTTIEEAVSESKRWTALSDKSYVQRADGIQAYYIYMSANRDALLITSGAAFGGIHLDDPRVK